MMLDFHRLKNGILWSICACVFLVFFSCNDGRKAPRDQWEEGVSWELAQHRKATISDLSYTMEVEVPRLKDGPLTGSNLVKFKLASTDRPVTLDFKVTIDKLTAVTIDSKDVPYEFEQGHISIDGQFFSVGENEIFLAFELGDQSLNRQEDFLYTLLVPDRASTAFPCFDQPNMKARYTLTLKIPATFEALTNGALVSETVQDSMKVLQYETTQPLPTYLFDFVVGDFEIVAETIEGTQMTMLHRESDKEAVDRNLETIFDLHAASIAWLEEYTGIKMPFQKFDFALIPSFQYGGMEHPGAITYNASSLFLDKNPTQSQELSRASLIAHETAHMWFGNLVTMNWFDDVWMKEVFANFMAAKIVNPTFPDIDHDLRFTLAHYPGAYGVDRTAGTHPVQQELLNLKDAGSLYGSIIYQKAPIVMRMLEKEIGEVAMQNGLQAYLQTYSYDNATWDDLIAILDKQSDSDLETWNQQWIKRAGMPHVKIARIQGEDQKSSGIELTLENDESGQEWNQKLLLAAVGDDVTSGEVNFTDRRKTASIEMVENETLAIIPNADGYGYGFFEMDEVSRDFLLENINDIKDPMLRGVSWINLWENLLNQQVAAKDLLETVMVGINVEQEPLIKQRILGYAGAIYWKFLSRADQKEVGEVLEEKLWDTFMRTSDHRIKKSLFNAYRGIAESPQALERLRSIWAKEREIKGLSLSENDYIQLAFHLAVRAFPSSEEIIKEQVELTKNSDRKARMKFVAPALSSDQTVRDDFFESLKDEENRQIESWVQAGLSWLHHPLRASDSEKYILPTLEMMEEIKATGDIFFPKRVLDRTFSGHRSKAVVEIVEGFLAGRPNYPANLRNKILQSSDMTFRASK